MKSCKQLRRLAREILDLSYGDKNFLLDLVENLEEKDAHKIFEKLRKAANKEVISN